MRISTGVANPNHAPIVTVPYLSKLIQQAIILVIIAVIIYIFVKIIGNEIEKFLFYHNESILYKLHILPYNPI